MLPLLKEMSLTVAAVRDGEVERAGDCPLAKGAAIVAAARALAVGAQRRVQRVVLRRQAPVHVDHVLFRHF